VSPWDQTQGRGRIGATRDRQRLDPLRQSNVLQKRAVEREVAPLRDGDAGARLRREASQEGFGLVPAGLQIEGLPEGL